MKIKGRAADMRLTGGVSASAEEQNARVEADEKRGKE